MAPIFSKIGRSLAKIGRKFTPNTRHGIGHIRRKHMPTVALIGGGVALGVAGDAIANEIIPDPEIPIFVQGEISPVHTVDDRSFSLFHIQDDEEEFLDESSHDVELPNNSTGSDDDLGPWHPTNVMMVHRGSIASRRIKGAIISFLVLLVLYILYRTYKRLRTGCSDSPSGPKGWGGFPTLPKLQIFTSSQQPTSPDVPIINRPAPGSFEAAPKYTMPANPLDYANYHGLTLDDLNRWVQLAHSSEQNALQISQSISPSNV